MSDTVTFTNFITKGLSTEEVDGRRIIKGHITSEVVDRQDEYVAVNEVLAIIKNYFEVFPAINDWHSNRIVGKAYKYEKSEIEGHPSVYIEAEIFKKEDVKLYDQVWEKIVKQEYKGFSMGGASKNREPVVKNGKLVMNLKNLELYEISVCPVPANQFALITYVNEFAKASNLEIIKAEDGRERLQCSGIECEFHKMEKHEYKCDGETSMCDRCGGDKSDNVHQMEIKKQDKEEIKEVIEEEHEKLGEKPDEKEKKVHEELIAEAKKSDYSSTVTIDASKLEEIIKSEIKKQYMAFNKPIRGHTWGYWQNKLKEDNPEYTDDQADSVIASWEEEEKMKKQETREANGTDKNIDKDLNNDKKEDEIELKVSEAGHRVTEEAKEKAKIIESLKSIKTKNDLILMLRL